jgi:MoxR-like ATPase
MTELYEKFRAVEEDMALSVLDRTEELHSAMLALVAQQHMFLLGKPGIAKSMLFDQLIARIIEINTFKWQLNKFSVPEEVFGGPDLLTLKDTGVYRRITDGKLPTAHLGWIDEVFKANSSILNALLLIINEREFMNPGDDPNVPLISLFTASNEMPQSSELEALVDRLLIRHIVKELQDPDLIVQMLALEPREPQAFLSLADIEQANKEANEVEIGDNIYSSMLELSTKLRREGIDVTDRRLKQSMSIIKAEAWLNGRNVAEVIDTRPLVYVMWRNPAHFEQVRKMVLDLADPIEREVLKLREELEKAYSEFKLVMDDEDNKHTRAKQSMQTYGYFKKARAEYQELRTRQLDTGRTSKSLEDLRRRMKELAPIILAEGIGLPDTDAEQLDTAIENRSDGF